jgi:hypothetical protein
MSAFANPFGLAPTLSQSGIIRPAPTPGFVASGFATNLFLNAPVQVFTDGSLNLPTALGAAGAGAAVNRIIGAMQGAEFTFTATGRRTVSNFWPASTGASAIVLWYTRDPWLTYEIQANGSITLAMLGNQLSLSTNGSANGNTTTGFSTVSADVTTGGSRTGTSTNQLRIVGFSQRVDNAAGDAFTIIQVQISMHQDVANQVAYGTP